MHFFNSCNNKFRGQGANETQDFPEPRKTQEDTLIDLIR